MDAEDLVECSKIKKGDVVMVVKEGNPGPINKDVVTMVTAVNSLTYKDVRYRYLKQCGKLNMLNVLIGVVAYKRGMNGKV